MWVGIASVFGIGAVATVGFVRNQVRGLLHFGPEGGEARKPEEMSALDKVVVLARGARIPRPTNSRTPADLGFEFETTRLPIDGGHELEIWTVAGGPDSVVLFHGYTEGKAQVLDGITWFHQRGLTVHLVDFCGSGGSTGSETTLGLREGDQAAAVLRWASKASRKSLAYGFSMGGVAVLRALATHDLTVDGIIVDGVFDRLSTTLAHRFHTLGIPASPGRELLMVWGSLELRSNAWRLAPVEYATAVHVPALAVGGSSDPRVHPAETENIGAALPRGRSVLLEGGGHDPGFVSSPGAWSEHVGPFVDTVLDEGSPVGPSAD